jgi:predicted SAM-dependent methyltransferase
MTRFLRPSRNHWQVQDRTFLAHRFLRGNGLEIGALHNPLPVPAGVRVRYLDRMPVNELRQHYPELDDVAFVPLDLIDDGETLKSVPQHSQDFIIANHFLEHCEDPIGAFKNFHRVVKPGGILYLAVPDKWQTFDRERPVTKMNHLWQDHTQGPDHSRLEHYLEWAQLVDHRTDDTEDHASRLMQQNYSIHFHVWDQSAWHHFLEEMQKVLRFRVEWMCQYGIELISVLRKK